MLLPSLNGLRAFEVAARLLQVDQLHPPGQRREHLR